MYRMEESFLQFQKYYKQKYFKKTFNEYYNIDTISKLNYTEFMTWCNSSNTYNNAKQFCKSLGILEGNIKLYIKMINILVFSYFHPILFKNDRLKELVKVSDKLTKTRSDFIKYCNNAITTNKYLSFLVYKQLAKECLVTWTSTVEEWREMDKCLLVQDCIINYVELMNLEEQLKENAKNEKTDSIIQLNKITSSRITEEKMKCKARVKSIDGERGLHIMNEILKHVTLWDKNEEVLRQQIKKHMNKAFWDNIREDIEKQEFESCQLNIKDLVKECGLLFENNMELLDNLVEEIDFDFMEQRRKTRTTDARYWYSIFITFIGFLKDCDALHNEGIYLSKIDELYTWTGQMSFTQFKGIFFWIKYRIYDILDRKKTFEGTPNYEEWKKERIL